MSGTNDTFAQMLAMQAARRQSIAQDLQPTGPDAFSFADFSRRIAPPTQKPGFMAGLKTAQGGVLQEAQPSTGGGLAKTGWAAPSTGTVSPVVRALMGNTGDAFGGSAPAGTWPWLMGKY